MINMATKNTAVSHLGLSLAFQTFGAIDWEMFQIENRVFLAVANSQMLTEEGKILYSINSTIYELSMASQTFIKFQDIETNRWIVNWSS